MSSFSASSRVVFYAALALVALFVCVPARVDALTLEPTDDYLSADDVSVCPSLSITMLRGATDATTGGQVSELQSFLADYFSIDESTLVTGRFARLTQSYVIKFQKAHRLPAYGTVGTLTRAKIAEVCNGNAVGSAATGNTSNATQNNTLHTTQNTTQGTTQNTTLAPAPQHGLPMPGSFTITTDSSSPAYRLASGGAEQIVVGVFKLRAQGESITLTRVGLSLVSGRPGDLTSVTLYSQTGTFLGSAVFTGTNTSAVTELSSPLTLARDTDTRLVVKVSVANIGVGQSGTSGNLIKIHPNDQTRGTGVTSGLGMPASITSVIHTEGVRIFKSYPASVHLVSLPSSGLSDGRLIRFSVTASSAGMIGLAQIPATISGLARDTNGQVDLYAYTDANYSSPIAGFQSGAINGLAIKGEGKSGGYLWFPRPVEIPAGATYYFELRNSEKGTGVTNTSALTTTIGGQGSYGGLVSATSLDGKDAMFVWSPNTFGTSAFTDQDWTTGYGIPGLSVSGITQTRTGTVIPNQMSGYIDYGSLSSTLSRPVISGGAFGTDRVIVRITEMSGALLDSGIVSVSGTRWSYTTAPTQNGTYKVTLYGPDGNFRLAEGTLTVNQPNVSPRPLCGLFRGGTSQASHMIASPNPATSVADTDTACISYCNASGGVAGDMCMRGGAIIKLYPAVSTDYIGGCANPPVITGPDAIVGVPYRFDPGVSNAGAPYPSLPNGLTKSNGIITGTPTAQGSVSVKIFALNSCGAIIVNFNIVAPQPVVTVPPAPSSMSYECSQNGNSVTLRWASSAGATGYNPSFHFYSDDPTCPSGWSLYTDGQTCFISETPSTSVTVPILPNVTYSAWVHAKNTAGASPVTYLPTASSAFSCPAPVASAPSNVMPSEIIASSFVSVARALMAFSEAMNRYNPASIILSIVR